MIEPEVSMEPARKTPWGHDFIPDSWYDRNGEGGQLDMKVCGREVSLA